MNNETTKRKLAKEMNEINTSPVAERITRPAPRRKHPAVSARILTLGLSTTALIGLTTGYSFSQKAAASTNTNVVPLGTTSANTTTGIATTQQAATQQVASQPLPANTQVIQVPVPAAANAGNVAQPAPAAAAQVSSGSR
ncbi:MAG: hypothetical protein NTV13_01875 [Actinobacteria bacterium]|nr:hypothetical protein [Actinomycetota bacterium]